MTSPPGPAASTTDDHVMAAAQRCLRALAGQRASLRPDQWSAIKALVVDRRRALVVQRTGWGKSAVYFIATALLREQGAGPTVIVSPLLALMRNQIAAAERAGIRAATINSSNAEEWEEIYTEILAGQIDVLLVSPERLNNPGFRDKVLPRLAGSAGMLVIDEAHCISDWGHDFRPDYRRLREMAAGLPAGIPVLATTATANARVTRDIAEQIGTSQGGPSPTLVLRGPLDRDSLELSVVRLPQAALRLGWLADHLGGLPGSGIVYTLTVAGAHEVAEFLRERGLAVQAYTGQTDPEQRLHIEESLLTNKFKAVVATSALGMGYDKPDLGFIVHLGAPQSPVAYYQQIGRAGRGVERAEVILLPATEDRDIWAYFASLAFPPERMVRATLDVLTRASGPLSLAALEAQVDLGRSRLEIMLKVLDVDGAVRRVSRGWEATGQPWAYDTERYERVAAERTREQKAMLGYVATTSCRMDYLRRELDDPAAAACGRCDNCTGAARTTQVSQASEETARTRLQRPGVTLQPRRMWPTGMAELGVAATGRISAQEAAEPGRSVGRLTDIGWGVTLRQLLADGAADQVVPDNLFKAVVQVLAAWDWDKRPVGVVTVPSRTRPNMINSLGERIAATGRLTYLGSLDYMGGEPPGRQHNSAQRLAALSRTLTVPGPLRVALAGTDGPVLLVDDRVDTGWTMTFATKLLRGCGARAVLPFALAVTN
ncbi:MAG TPA: RecQ family ATP-dependent DNA helicase [Streptosporangiaceae bacterium]|nr:RecQ family ATP-dependent DNA helicase [Streptosporangiaceae bacterium]